MASDQDKFRIVNTLVRQFTRDAERVFGEGRRLSGIEKRVIQVCAESMANSILVAKRREENK